MAIKLKKQAASTVTTPEPTHTQLFVDTDGLIKLKDNTGSVTHVGTIVNAGNPEGSVTAGIGILCSDALNGELYIKHTGTGNTGWKLMIRTA